MITLDELASRFKDHRITVVGDLMLDRYIVGSCERISKEAPVPIVKRTYSFTRLGGAGNVVANLQGLGAKVRVFGSVAQDKDGKELMYRIGKITSQRCFSISFETNVKTRIIGKNQQIVRVDSGEPQEIMDNREDVICGLIRESKENILISDYGKGFVTGGIIDACLHAKERNRVQVYGDIKTDFQYYAGLLDAITPNSDEMDKIIWDIRGKEVKLPGIVLHTMGDYGVEITNNGVSESFPSMAKSEVVDTCGAGDTIFAVFSLCLSCGISPRTSAYIANIAAGITVSHVGVYSITIDELTERLKEVCGKGIDNGIQP
jgi:D-beta-D-heptose 7-phosphate kinase / D-beta-D-heptose 1-phosphate adenosyltransferase